MVICIDISGSDVNSPLFLAPQFSPWQFLTVPQVSSSPLVAPPTHTVLVYIYID